MTSRGQGDPVAVATDSASAAQTPLQMMRSFLLRLVIHESLSSLPICYATRRPSCAALWVPLRTGRASKESCPRLSASPGIANRRAQALSTEPGCSAIRSRTATRSAGQFGCDSMSQSRMRSRSGGVGKFRYAPFFCGWSSLICVISTLSKLRRKDQLECAGRLSRDHYDRSSAPSPSRWPGKTGASRRGLNAAAGNQRLVRANAITFWPGAP